MNITIFKTWHMESNTYSYWKDSLPTHDKYNLILGQAIIPESVQELNRMGWDYSGDFSQTYLRKCYYFVENSYEAYKTSVGE